MSGSAALARETSAPPASAAAVAAPDAPVTAGFWSLIATQFQISFSDSALKNLVIFVVMGAGLAAAERDRMVFLIGVAFSVPFILFSMAGGYFADRYSKRSVAVGVKVFEVAVMLLALFGLARGSLGVQVAAVSLMGIHSAFYGPAKYGILPEILPEKRLSWGNGILEMGTMVAIITGTLAAGILSESFVGRQWISGGILFGLSAVGLLLSLLIPRVPPADAARVFQLNPLAELWRELKEMSPDRVLKLAVAGNTYFWFLAVLLGQNIIFYASDVLHVTQTQTGYLQGALTIGIGAGSLAAGFLSGRKIEYGLVPLGSLGMSAFCAALSQPSLSFLNVAVRLALLGFFSGFFLVPVNALLQHRPSPERKGGVLATANLLSFVGIFLASGAYYVLQSLLRLGPAAIFLMSAGLTVLATAYCIKLLPDALMRLILWLLTHTVYRVRVIGRDNIPEKGGALFVVNHPSYIDAAFLIAATDRFVRFIMYREFYEYPLVKPLAKVMKTIPISSAMRPREMIHSLRTAAEAIRQGEVVCIFAEGQVTRIGQMLPFARGFERIMKDVEAPIIPVSIEGAWGSIFSFERGRFLWKLPESIPYPVTVSFGAPMPSKSTPTEVRQAVQELQTEAWAQRKTRMKTLGRAFRSAARRQPRRFALADGQTGAVRAMSALLRSIFLARRLREAWKGQEMVGILLPPCVPGALVNWAALLSGRVPVNLNYTASDDVIASCVRQCGIQTVVTSQAFLDKVKLTVPVKTILVEQVAAQPRLGERLVALVLGWLAPFGWLQRHLGEGRHPGLDDLATIIFSSGSTGDPKGVMLTHYNIGSNVDQIGQTFALDGSDRILGILPFFHSFGFTATLAMPGMLGVGVVYHVSPLDSRVIGGLTRQFGATFLLATPTFLQAYIRRCEPSDFGSLKFVMAGAEKLPERVAAAFEDRFGIRPLEGYGTSECAPVVTVSTRDYRAAGFRQIGSKRGKIGHPVPGLSVRVVDPETGAPRPIGEPGLLLVKGPNIMKGYLGQPEKTAAVLKDGWYTTGDMASVDADGFLQITDRLSRFSKIGGEMVPHVKVEDTLQELAGEAERVFAVTAVPDEKKGERLIVLHTLKDEALRACLEKLASAGLPNLWVPRAGQFVRVEAIPHLGSGKLDLRRLREMAAGHAGAAASE
jgi:acyl-[acyl-carrier-protein]-phospholipid O-acyltransferase/long-chain-fatty-acid--[acyl-carrier-protein] ligase